MVVKLGARGEFHTFAFDGPIFSKPVGIEAGEITEREGFVYADVLSALGVSALAGGENSFL